MKKLIFLFYMLISGSVIQSQIIEDYPFKTLLDEENNLYVVGNKFNPITNSIDILIEKFDNEGNVIFSKFIPYNTGIDKGIDLDVDILGNIFISGYIFNSINSSNDIISISLNLDGTIKWNKIYNNPGDDKGMGIAISKNENGYATDVYITGYITNPSTGKDFIVKKLDADSGNTIWQSVYNIPTGDDIATDILLDAGYAYVVGYTYGNGQTTSDIMIQSYDKEFGQLHDNHVHLKPGTNERPTGFCIPFPSGDPISKSRSSISSITDEVINNQIRTGYFTICYDPDHEERLVPRWSRTLNGGNLSRTNVPTALASDISGDIYVTGYMYNSETGNHGNPGYDFATVKYSGDNGGYMWSPRPVIFTNYNDTSTTGVDDKATSVKVNSRKDLFIAGTSQGSPNGYSIAMIEQSTQDPSERYRKAFIPNFLDDGASAVNLNKWATIELTSDGTPIMIVMGWNENESHWAAIKFDSLGNEEYTINNDPVSSGNSIIKNSDKQKQIIVKNYPNPFNPKTIISYELGSSNFVDIKVYDMMGREVKTLVHERRTPGIYSVAFDGSSLSSGVYYYTVSLDGIRMENKSMVLMK